MPSPSVSCVFAGGVGVPVVLCGVDQRQEVSLGRREGQSGIFCRVGNCDVVPKSQGGLVQPLNDVAARRLGKVIAVPSVLPEICTR